MRLRTIVPVVALVAVMGACGDSDAPTAGPKSAPTTDKPARDGGPGASATTVLAKGLAFKPAKITVAKGAVVTWKFDDGVIPHNVAFDDVQSETVAEGTFEHTFDETGEFKYTCTLHPTMKGTVTVK